MTHSIGLVYTENDIELLKPIEMGVVCDKTRQDVTDCIMLSMSKSKLSYRDPSNRVWYVTKTRRDKDMKIKLSCCDRLDRVQSVTKTRQDNDVTNYIGLVYVETEIEFLGLISPSAIRNEN